MKALTKTLCGFALCLMIALSVGGVYRYKADQYFDQCRRYSDKKDYDRMLKPLVQAVEWNPFELYYLNILNILLLKLAVSNKDLGLLERSITGAELVCRMYPEEYHSYYTIGQAYHILGRREEAIKYYRKAMELNPLKAQIPEKLKTLL